MQNLGRYIVALFASSFLTSCTIGYYSIRGEFGNPGNIKEEQCEISYTISLLGAVLGDRKGKVYKYTDEMIKLMQSGYVKSTEEMFNKLGCRATYVVTEPKANLYIRVMRMIDPFIPPQEELTYRTLGIIPGWSTKPHQFVYTFTDNDKNRKYTYYIDKNSYHSLLLIPFFWINMISDNELEIYDRALFDFLKSNKNIPDDDYEANRVYNYLTDSIYEQKTPIKIHYTIKRESVNFDLCKEGINVSVKEVLGKTIPDNYIIQNVKELGMDLRIGVNGRTFRASGDIASFIHTAITDVFKESGCPVYKNAKNTLNIYVIGFDTILNGTTWEGNVLLRVDLNGKKVLIQGKSKSLNMFPIGSAKNTLESSFDTVINSNRIDELLGED